MKSIILILSLLFCNNVLAAKQFCEASWYGGSFQGRKTASGVKFDTNKFMAAHKTLKFGTKVLVTNLNNGKSTSVVILDKGPYIKGRCVDLSYVAKNAIGMGGTAPVSLQVIK